MEGGNRRGELRMNVMKKGVGRKKKERRDEDGGKTEEEREGEKDGREGWRDEREGEKDGNDPHIPQSQRNIETCEEITRDRVI